MPVFFLVSALVAALDYVFKYLVSHNMTVGQSVPVIPGIRLTYVQNRGMAFGMLSDSRWVFLVLSTVMIAALIYYIAFQKGYAHMVYVSMALALGGGIGNMIDRLLYGYVIDYVDFYPLPFWTWVFNLADAAICAVVVLFAVYLLFFEKKAKAAGKKAFFDDAPKKSPDGDSR